MQISREIHCALAGIDVEAFKTLQRYGRLPVLPAHLRPNKPFGPLDTLTLAIYNTIVEQHRVAREYAANICNEAGVLLTRWSELCDSVEQRRLAGKEELFFGRITLPGTLAQRGGPKPAFGTLEEIAAQHMFAITIIAVSATRIANLISNRAVRHGVDLGHFWATPATKQGRGR